MQNFEADSHKVFLTKISVYRKKNRNLLWMLRMIMALNVFKIIIENLPL